MTIGAMTFDNSMIYAYSQQAVLVEGCSATNRGTSRGGMTVKLSIWIATVIMSLWTFEAPAFESANEMADGQSQSGLVAVSDYFVEFPVVLSASRLKQSISQAPAAVTVIDREMIVASGARRIEELLRLVPGFYIGYTNGSSPIVAYHGLSDAFAKRMQVLIDGVSIYSPLWGGVEWAELPLTLADIDRIEVVRGPNAVSYGANAFLAVINIITRDPATESPQSVDANFGGNGIRDMAVRLARQGDDWRYRVSAGQRYDDGFTFRPDSSKITIAGLRAHYRLNPQDELAFQIRSSRGNETQGYYNTAIDDSGVQRPRDVNQNTIQVRWTRAQSADDEFWLQANHQSHSLREMASVYLLISGLPPIPYSFTFDYDLTRDDVEFQKTGRFNDALRWVWGGQWRADSAHSRSFFYRNDWLDNQLTRLFGNVEWQPVEQLTINGGVMVERNSMTSTSASPRLAANWFVAPGHSLRFAVSRANRAPTLFEDHTNQTYDLPPLLSSYASGVPAKITYLSSGSLKDERILSREIGYVAEIPQWKLQGDIRFFRDHIDSLIYSATTKPVVALFNRTAADYFNSARDVHEHGHEFSLRWQPWSGAQLNVSSAYTRIDSEMADTTQSVPAHTHSLLFQQAMPQQTMFSAAWYKVATMRWQSAPSSIPAYNTIDLRLAKQLRWDVMRAEVSLVTRNVLGAYRDYNLNNYQRRISYLQLNLEY